MIRLAEKEDLNRIVEIYNQGVLTYRATADDQPVSVASKQDWFESHQVENRPLWVLESNGEVAAWLSFNTFYGRPAYDSTVEISLYVGDAHQRQGHGRRLLEHSIDAAPDIGINNILGLIFAHNEASLKLFKQHGFSEWGNLPAVAFLNDRHCDLVILGRQV